MAGFFKKLFNRIVGKSADETVPAQVEQVALPASEAEPEIISEVEKPRPAKSIKPKSVIKPKAKSKTPTPPAKKAAARVQVVKPIAKKAIKASTPPPPPSKVVRAKPIPVVKAAPAPKAIKVVIPKAVPTVEPKLEIVAPANVIPPPLAPEPIVKDEPEDFFSLFYCEEELLFIGASYS